MNDSDTTNARGMDRFDCRLRQFERNRYFHGKLMTARDMRTEQQYHAGRMHTHSRYVTGVGIVCGLDVDVEAATDDSGSPTAVVDPGVAVDGCGRQIVVEAQERIDIPAGTAGGGQVSVYIAHATCKTESVPVTGSEDACGDECEYNRLRQTYRVTFESTPPGAQKPVPVDRVELPTLDKVRATGDDDQVAPGDDVLHELSRSYHAATNDDGRIRTCQSVLESQTETEDRIFLGTFTEQSDGNWAPATDDPEPRPYVYTNEMLHAGLVDHVTDFGNPHDVVATVDEVEPVDGDVELRSVDGSVVSDPIPGEGAVDLQVGPGLQEYVRDKCLKYTIEAFYDVAETYAEDSGEGDAAGEVVDRAVEIILRARDALDAREFADSRAFAAAVLDLARMERRLLLVLEEYGSELVTDRSLADYQQAMERLLGLLPRTDSGRPRDDLPEAYETPAELAVAQDQLCETAAWLERSTDETMTLPGGTEVERRIIEDAIEPSGGARPIDPTLDPTEVVVADGGTASFDVGFGDAATLGFVVEDENGLRLIEATLTKGTASTVTLKLDTGAVESASDRLTVGGDATLTVGQQPGGSALDAGEYAVSVSRGDPSGGEVDSATVTIRAAETASLGPAATIVNGATTTFDVNFRDTTSVGVRLGGPEQYLLEAELTKGSDATVTLRFDTGAVSSQRAPTLVVEGDANLNVVEETIVEVLTPGQFVVSLLQPDLSGNRVDRTEFAVSPITDFEEFDPESYVGRPAASVAGELYSRYDDVTVNYRPLSEADAEPGTILEATPPRDADSPPTLTVAGTGFENISGIGTTNRRNLFDNGIFTAEEFSTADRASLENILSSNVNLDSIMENVHTEIDFS
ncbi:hypothetical protein [Salinigranum halophilum]|uniref:hypothetical protein n=1 Tax=Salinigranum halophilum TaxID=2565931 RepID=UPI0010A863E7|nr:hypothetical protein [Salinigranum halophilum]